MEYNREINDGAKIQCIILYTLSVSERALRYDDLINLIFENCNVNYVEFQIALSNLTEIGHITKTLDTTGCDVFSLNSAGAEAIKYLESTLPAYIKIPIKKYIKPYFKEETAKQKIKSAIEAVRNDEYNSLLGIYDDDNLPLLEIKLYSGSREEAQKTAELFKKHPETIYRKIVDILIASEDDTTERE
ncbi:MAG: DUF4364 family protein [Clostridia bacterium]|nr:DUF4364 family protein [Clostridia bacterium]